MNRKIGKELKIFTFDEEDEKLELNMNNVCAITLSSATISKFLSI